MARRKALASLPLIGALPLLIHLTFTIFSQALSQNTVTLGVEASIYEFVGKGDKHSVPTTPQPQFSKEQY